MAFLAQLVCLFLLAASLNKPVIAAELLKCWTCSSDLQPSFCKDALIANGTTDERMFTPCTADNNACKTQIVKIADSFLVTRGCAAKCENSSGSIFCDTCTSSGCNNKGCDDKTCNKNGSTALGKSVALIIVSLGFLYCK